jgi:hypothetical protein
MLPRHLHFLIRISAQQAPGSAAPRLFLPELRDAGRRRRHSAPRISLSSIDVTLPDRFLWQISPVLCPSRCARLGLNSGACMRCASQRQRRHRSPRISARCSFPCKPQPKAVLPSRALILTPPYNLRVIWRFGGTSCSDSFRPNFRTGRSSGSSRLAHEFAASLTLTAQRPSYLG